MIDIHHHCLPGVDDGPRSLDDAEQLCRAALAEGIDEIIATPHVLRGRWRSVERAEMETRLDALRSRLGDRPRLHLGSEYFFAHDMADVLRAGTAIVPLAGSRYVLTELPANSVPPHLERPLHAVQLDGWTPVLAHPERNAVFQQHPELLAGLAGLGVRMQLTATSLTGAFGPAARKTAETMVRLRLVHFVATDAHGLPKRPPDMAAARSVLERLAGPAVTQALTVDNPRAVLENRPLPYDPEPIAEGDGFFTRVRAFFFVNRP